MNQILDNFIAIERSKVHCRRKMVKPVMGQDKLYNEMTNSTHCGALQGWKQTCIIMMFLV